MQKLIFGRPDIATAIHAEIVRPLDVPFLSDLPAFEIPRYSATLPKCDGRMRANAFGKGEAALIDDGNGNPTFAELVLLDRFRAAGWNCVWFEPFGGQRYISAWPWDAEKATVERNEIVEPIGRILERIAKIKKLLTGEPKLSYGGAADVAAWRGNDIVFLECKRVEKDRLNDNQVAWLHSAVLAGLKGDDLGVFEWDY